ncbi:type I polyketide synthase [Actinokineospora sp. G85]|uniref:type I polyketide synthase n=1 Tax=Actinokineospora sp. G85 TaxID=3406626 RepID=UPI003C70771C
MRDGGDLRDAVAVVGVACRFPGAEDVGAYWRNVAGGVESVSFFSADELAAAGVSPALSGRPDYVPARAVLADWDRFDAAFFDYSAREAELTDPQQRHFLEVAWSALEDAGYPPTGAPGRVGVYAGASASTYLLARIAADPSAVDLLASVQTQLGNAGDFLATRVAHRLGLTGPALTVQTACSTSLVAIHLACQSLLGAECDMAIAGGASIQFPQESGYLYQNGGILSKDGHCRAFDEAAGGVVMGSGVGAVVLKRWQDAVDDGDFVHAVVRGSAVNNDGSAKVGFTAPSVTGQAAVVVDALEVAGLDPATIGMVEAHGTGTALGDPIEVAALTQAWRRFTDATGFCALGSVKTNIGHLDAAAGVAGFVKAVLAVREGVLPPSLNFSAPNKEIDFAASPFYVNTGSRPWSSPGPRRAAVSAFGIGGTNAHVLLEQAPARDPLPAPARPWQVLPVSARSREALAASATRLADRLAEGGATPADAAFTLQTGREAFAHRRAVVARTTEEAVRLLRQPGPEQEPVADERAGTTDVVLLFPGQGSRHAGVGRGLYEREPVYREHYDRCADIAAPLLGRDLRELPVGGKDDEPRTDLDHPAIFAIEYALAQLWLSWGITPVAAMGHTLGEYAAACLAGVFSLEDALAVVIARGRLVQSTAPAPMLVVGLGEERAREVAARSGLSLAAVNSADQCVLSGAADIMADVERQLTDDGVAHRRLRSARAFNSPVMDSVLAEFRAVLDGVALAPPRFPVCSNVTGAWLTDEQATDPGYWVSHLREPVRLADSMDTLLRSDRALFVEAGPGTALAWLVRRWSGDDQRSVASFPVAGTPADEEQVSVLRAAAGLWESGAALDWAAVRGGGGRRVPLPTYPFAGGRYRLGESAAITADPAPTTAHERRGLRVAYAEPETDIQRAVADVYGQFLGYDRIGIHDDLLQLGADSLLMVEVAARFDELYAVSVPIEQVFQHPTVADQAVVIERLLAGADGGGA